MIDDVLLCVYMCLNVVCNVVMHVGNIICQTMPKEILGSLKGEMVKHSYIYAVMQNKDMHIQADMSLCLI